MSFLVDTNVITELTRPRLNRGLELWAAQAGPVLVSAVTVDEIAFGLAWRPHPRLEAWFRYFFDNPFR
jgi:predicted nucleic acid-binding protein